MVNIEEVSDNPSASQERLLDAEEIEKVAGSLQRPTARMHLESLAKKLRKEAAALKVVEENSSASRSETSSHPAPAPVAPPKPIIATEPPKPVPVSSAAPPSSQTSSSVTYTTIDRFSFDAGGYDDKFVTVYVPLPGVGTLAKENVNCQFEKASFDLIVKDLRGKSYRLKKDQLEHDIDVDKSKIVIKADKIVIKLAKVKGDYSYDYWSKLTDPKRNDKKKANPAASITELMKDMYESGDDNMRKIIGETMLKQQRGELGSGMDMGLGGLGEDGM